MADRARGRFLLGGFPSAEEALEYSERHLATEPAWIREQWPRARAAFLQTRQPLASGRVEEPEPLLVEAIEEILEAPLFRASLASRRWRIGEVPLVALATPQPLIVESRAEALEPGLRGDPIETLFPTTTELGIHPEALPGPAIAIHSDRAELAVSGMRIQRSEDGALELVFRVEPRPNYVSVLEARDSLMIRNGNHRFLVALRAGMRSVPCVIISAEGDEALESRADRFPPAAWSVERSPRLTDFVDDEVCIDVDLKRRVLPRLYEPSS